MHHFVTYAYTKLCKEDKANECMSVEQVES